MCYSDIYIFINIFNTSYFFIIIKKKYNKKMHGLPLKYNNLFIIKIKILILISITK